MKYVSALMVAFLLFGIYSCSDGVYQENVSKDNIRDAYIKNVKWDSGLEEDIPYTIGNELEFYYLLDANSGSLVELDISKLSDKVDIQSIALGEKELENTANIAFTLEDNTPLKIKGVSKVNNNKNDSVLKDLIDVEILSQGEDGENNTTENQEKIDKNNIQLSLLQTRFSSDVNNILEFSGENIEQIRYLNIGSVSYEPAFKDGKGYVLISKKTFDSGDYFVFFQTKTGEIVSLDQQVSFTLIGENVYVGNITPQEIQNDKNRSIILQGNGFDKVISVQLNNNLVLKDRNIQILNDRVLQLDIPEGLSPGKYSLNIMTSDNIVKINNVGFRITQ